MEQIKLNVVIVAHSYECTGQATIWLIPGPYNAEDPLPDKHPPAIKVAGPLAFELSVQIADGLSAALAKAGIETRQQTTADD
jgi:hypothetical protein